MSADVTVRLRIDSSSGRAELDSLDRRIDQSARAAQRGLGGGAGGLLGRALGLGGGGLTGLGLAAQFGGPIAGDAATVTGGILGTAGSMLSNSLGLRGWANDISAAKQAQEATKDALGPAAAGMSAEEIGKVFDAKFALLDLKAKGDTAVEAATNGRVLDVAANPIVSKLDELIKAVQSSTARASTGGPSLPGAGR